MADVGCAGILVEDIFCGPMQQMPPEGLLTAIDEMPVHLGGCAPNVAISLARQDVSVEMSGCLGQDTAADSITAGLEACGIGCSGLVRTNDFPTSRTIILLVKGQDRRFIHMFGANKAYRVADIDRDWVSQLKVFYLGGLFAMPAVDCGELTDLLQFCRDQGIVTAVDVVVPEDYSKGLDEIGPVLPYIDWFTPNDDESRLFTGTSDTAEQMKIFIEHGAASVIITTGETGALAGRGESRWRCGVYPTDVVDPSGSGDAFTAGVLTGVVREMEMPDILRYGSALGSSCARAVGTTTGVFTAKQAEEYIEQTEFMVEEG
jgi:sugar/nucleoside kinase (ribokinase family)